jgi:enoyl-CoA hydratase/carnithine racemase
MVASPKVPEAVVPGCVRLRQTGAVAWVTLANPAKFNAMSRAMWADLQSAFLQIQQEMQIRCVVVQGADANFCAGGDISEYPDFRFVESTLRDFHENEVWGALQAMLDCDVPVVAQIAGNCMGAGVEIASCCDLRVACRTSRFGAPIAKLGFPMAPREAALVLRALGELTAREMLLCAAVLDGSTMLRRGFLNHLVEPEQLTETVHQLVDRMVALAPLATRANKQALRALTQAQQAQEAIKLVAEAYRYAASDEHREGVLAFAQKRTPKF